MSVIEQETSAPAVTCLLVSPTTRVPYRVWLLHTWPDGNAFVRFPDGCWMVAAATDLIIPNCEPGDVDDVLRRQINEAARVAARLTPLERAVLAAVDLPGVERRGITVAELVHRLTSDVDVDDDIPAREAVHEAVDGHLDADRIVDAGSGRALAYRINGRGRLVLFYSQG
jgi:hypothetical protein